jgi:hypothetical protein
MVLTLIDLDMVLVGMIDLDLVDMELVLMDLDLVDPELTLVLTEMYLAGPMVHFRIGSEWMILWIHSDLHLHSDRAYPHLDLHPQSDRTYVTIHSVTMSHLQHINLQQMQLKSFHYDFSFL